MDIKISKAGTLQTAQLMSEKIYPSVVGECITRKMTPEEWEKYGPIKPPKKDKMIRAKSF